MSEPSYIRVQDTQVHETEDGLIVFDPASDRVHHLNFSAAVIYELCGEIRTQSELVKEFATLYELEEAPVDDIKKSIGEMLSTGILETVDI